MSAEIPLYAVVDKSKKTVKSPAGGDTKSQVDEIAPDITAPSVNIVDTNDTDSPYLPLPDTGVTDINVPHLLAEDTEKPPPIEPYKGGVSSSTDEKSEIKNVYETISLAKAVKKEDKHPACLPRYLAIFALAAITVVFIIVFMIVSLIAITANLSAKSEIAALQKELSALQHNLDRVNEGVENVVASLEATFEELRWNYSHILSSTDRNSEELLELRRNVSQLQNYVEVQQIYINELRGNYSYLYSEIQQHAEPECSSLISSCADLSASCPSDYYLLGASNGSVVRVYCDMTLSCGNITGGWTRVAELNMTELETSQQCPSNLVEKKNNSIRRCQTTDAGCSPTTYSVQSMCYNKVCGRITAYQIGTTNAFLMYYDNQGTTTINSTYVDGVSLTHGNPRQHIWTFAAALDRNNNLTRMDGRSSHCPCQFEENPFEPPPFVGEDYFCDAGNEEFMDMTDDAGLQTDPLWDGTDCLCCVSDNPPWFYKQLPQRTTDDIEMRVCIDEGSTNENIGIQEIEIYIQ